MPIPNIMIQVLRDRREAAERALHAIDLEIDEAVRQLVAPLRPDAQEIATSFIWECTDPTNPVGYCVYDEDEDPCRDECLFCCDPQERK